MIRGTLIFLLAVGLGALTVSGQDEGSEADLRRRIRALTEELRGRADAGEPKQAEAGRPVMRIYEIGDLILSFPHRTQAAVYLRPSGYTPPEPAEYEPSPGFEVDWMIDVIRQLIEPSTWEMIDGADIQPRSNRLFISNIPRVHKKVEAFLAALRTLTDRQLRVELYAVPVDGNDAALLAARTRELSNEEAGRMLDRPGLGSTEIVCRSNQNLAQRIGRRVRYLQDYDVEIAQEATIGDPITASAFSGMSVELRAMLDDAGNGARLDLQLDRTLVHEPIRRVDTEHGPLELPEMDLTRLQTTIWVPLDRFVVLGGSTDGARPCLFLGRITRAGMPK